MENVQSVQEDGDFMDFVCVITGIMFSAAGPSTMVEVLKICLSQCMAKIRCVVFSWNFVVWQELARIQTAPVFWEKEVCSCI